MSFNQSLSVSLATGILYCKGLDINSGGRITSASIITINGIVNVSGILHTSHSGSEAIKVESEGTLRIVEPGMVILEN